MPFPFIILGTIVGTDTSVLACLNLCMMLRYRLLPFSCNLLRSAVRPSVNNLGLTFPKIITSAFNSSPRIQLMVHAVLPAACHHPTLPFMPTQMPQNQGHVHVSRRAPEATQASDQPHRRPMPGLKDLAVLSSRKKEASSLTTHDMYHRKTRKENKS